MGSFWKNRHFIHWNLGGHSYFSFWPSKQIHFYLLPQYFIIILIPFVKNFWNRFPSYLYCLFASEIFKVWEAFSWVVGGILQRNMLDFVKFTLRPEMWLNYKRSSFKGCIVSVQFVIEVNISSSYILTRFPFSSSLTPLIFWFDINLFARSSKAKIKSNGESGHSCLVP